jgi:heme exporter protein C
MSAVATIDQGATLRRATALVLLGLAVAWLTLVVRAPLDGIQGVIQKILYVHVPAALAAYLGFVCTATGGALYLWRGEERYDVLARAAAEVGVLFCTLVLLTGPIWGKGTWGRWWSWDLRLTVTLLLWFVYLAYLLPRAASARPASPPSTASQACSRFPSITSPS